MHTEQLLYKLENEIWHGLNKRYSSHCPSLFFSKKLALDTVLSRKGFFTIPAHDSQISIDEYRLPQTRIRLIETICKGFRLRSIPLSDDHIFIIEPSNTGVHSKFAIQLNSGIQYFSSQTVVSIENEKLCFNLDQPLILWLSKNTASMKPKDLPHILHLHIEKEYANHPLSHVNSSTWKLLQQIDILWTDISDIDDDRNYLNENYTWLQEIYIHFGWYEKIEQTYNRIPEVQLNSYFRALKKRWICVRDNLKWETDSEIPDFLNQYISGSTDFQHLQDEWYKIHLPAYRIKAIEAIAAEPTKYIAFGLLAIQHQFIWADCFLNILFSALPASSHSVVELLFLLKKQNPYFHSGNFLGYTTPISLNASQKLHIGPEYALSHVYQKSKKQTAISIPKVINFKIDKAVQVKVNFSGTSIEVLPQLMQPVNQQPDFTILRIQYGNVQLDLALVWNQFKIELNGLRIKFLRKKNRFQFSISYIDTNKSLYIDDQLIEARESEDAKLYFSLNKRESHFELSALNKWGSFPSPLQRTYITGWAMDVFGVLHDHVNLSAGERKGSIRLALNKDLLENDGIDILKYTNTFSGRFLSKSEVDFKFIDGMIGGFLYTPSQLLKHKVTVYLSENRETIRNLFYETFGFYPQIRNLADQDESFTGYVFLVTDKYAENELKPDELFKTISLRGPNSRKGFLVHPQTIEKLLASQFKYK